MVDRSAKSTLNGHMTSTLCLQARGCATLLCLFLNPAGADVPTVQQLGYSDFPGVIHCHSHLSHDSEGTEHEIIAAAKKAGIRFIMMTDHPSKGGLKRALRGMHNGILFFPGLETRNLLLVDVRRPLARAGTDGARKEMLEQGGLSFAAHPEEFRDWDLPLTGMEIYNIHSDLLMQNKVALGIRFLAKYYKDREWAFALILQRPTAFIQRWDQLTRKRRVVGIAGNDAHQNVKIGREQIDPYARSFRFVRTHVLSKSLTPEAIKLNLARGHAYVAFDVFGNARGFSFSARTGNRTLLMGDEIQGFEGRATLSARLPRSGTIRLLRNGKVICTTTGRRLEKTVALAGVYRVEVDTLDKHKKIRPWIYANPIYLR